MNEGAALVWLICNSIEYNQYYQQWRESNRLLMIEIYIHIESYTCYPKKVDL